MSDYVKTQNVYLKYQATDNTIHNIQLENAVYKIEDLKVLDNGDLEYRRFDSPYNTTMIIKTLTPTPRTIMGDPRVEDIQARILRMFRRKTQLRYSQNVQQLRDGIVSLVKLLNKNAFLYWSERETTLGTLRHGGIVPWRIKPQLGFILDDLPELRQILQDDGRFYLIDNRKLYHLIPTHDENEELLPPPSPYGCLKVLDSKTFRYIAELYYYVGEYTQDRTMPMFWRKALSVKRKADPAYCTIYFVNNKCYPQDWKSNGGIFNIPYSYLFPLRRKPFYRTEIPVPQKAEHLLDYYYGANWPNRKRSSNSSDFKHERGYQRLLMAPKDYKPL
jgi:hypothetical protein